MMKSPVRRLGSKSKIIDRLLPMFPEFKIWIEPFFGSGSVGLNVKARYKFFNDLDGNIYDAWQVFASPEMKAQLTHYIEMLPYSDMVWEHIKQLSPQNIIEKVAKFMILSSWGFLGKPDTLSIQTANSKKELLKTIDADYSKLVANEIKWSNRDFEVFLNSISFSSTSINGKDATSKERAFVYCDPPYLETTNNYDTPTWTIHDFSRLIDTCIAFSSKFAISEFDNEDILRTANDRGLNVYDIGDRRNLGNRRCEILITNYIVKENQAKLF